MQSAFRKFVRRAIPIWLTESVRRLAERLDPFVKLSYSQDGEDMILRRLFEGQTTGFYVDIGAHHPFRFSNTCNFYRLGWSGINVDPNPDTIQAFQRERPRDINVCVGISDRGGDLLYHFFNEPALNTFDADLAAERQSMPGYHLLEKKLVPVQRLDALLAAHFETERRIDFMSIDVEGFDLLVLRSGDWSRFRPRVLLVEARQRTFAALKDDPINSFTESNGYRLIAKTVNTLIYEDGSASSPPGTSG